MHEAYYLIAGGVLALMIKWLIDSWMCMGEMQRRRNAEKILSKNGLKPHMYLASIGIENKELRRALSEYTGQIVLNSKGFVVGKLLNGEEKSPHLKLVVSND